MADETVAFELAPVDALTNGQISTAAALFEFLRSNRCTETDDQSELSGLKIEGKITSVAEPRLSLTGIDPPMLT